MSSKQPYVKYDRERVDMATRLKTRKAKARSQSRIYEHAENLYPQGYKEPLATKEFVRQELEPIKVGQNWTKAALAVLFTAVGGLYVLLWGFKTDIQDLKVDVQVLKSDFQELKTDIREIKALIQKK